MDFDAPRPWWPLGDMEQMHERVQLWVQQNFSPELTVRDWWARLAQAGLAAPTWDRNHGGLGATSQVQTLVEQALAGAGAIAPPTVHPAIRLVGPALRQFGSPALVRQLLPRMLGGLDRWTLMMFDVGVQDAASTAACRAELDWTHAVVNGRKACDDVGADKALVLTRSNGEGRKGLTWLIVDLAHPSLTAGDHHIDFNATRVSRDFVLGAPDEGWAVTRTILPYVDRSIAGRMRRGLVHLPPGTRAGNLDRVVGEVLAAHRRGLPPPMERRSR